MRWRCDLTRVPHDPGTPAPQGRSHLKGQTGAVSESDALRTVNQPVEAGCPASRGQGRPELACLGLQPVPNLNLSHATILNRDLKYVLIQIKCKNYAKDKSR